MGTRSKSVLVRHPRHPKRRLRPVLSRRGEASREEVAHLLVVERSRRPRRIRRAAVAALRRARRPQRKFDVPLDSPD